MNDEFEIGDAAVNMAFFDSWKTFTILCRWYRSKVQPGPGHGNVFLPS